MSMSCWKEAENSLGGLAEVSFSFSTPPLLWLNVNVNVNLYSASSQKAPLMRSMYRVLIKKTRLQCTTKTVNLHVWLTQIVFGTSSMSLVQRQRRCDGRTHRAETVEQRVDTQIWRHSCLNFSLIWLEMPIQVPKIGVLGDFGPLIVIFHHLDPQKAHPCVNPRFFYAINCKNLLRGLTCRRVDRKCDGHTHLYVPTIHCGENPCVLVGRCGERTHRQTDRHTHG